ncbi:unnamed protein product [Mortierella alpina]
MSTSSSGPSTPDVPNSPSNLPEQPQQPELQRFSEPPDVQEHEELDEPASFSTCPLPPTFTIVLNYRKGTPRTSCRQLKNLPPTAPWTFDRHRDTYRVLLARVEGYVHGLQGFTFPVDGRPYLQPTNNTYQKNYVELTEENYSHEMEATWRKEARRLNSITGAGVTLHLYIYLQAVAEAPAATSNTIRRVTAARAQAVRPIRDQAVEQNIIPAIGPVTRDHFENYVASLVPAPPLEEIAIPDTNTYRQTMYLDEERQRYDERQQARTEEERAPTRTILIEINGVEVPIKVNLQSLLSALNLPRFNLNGMHTFQARPLRRPQGDIEDVDHMDDT